MNQARIIFVFRFRIFCRRPYRNVRKRNDAERNADLSFDCRHGGRRRPTDAPARTKAHRMRGEQDIFSSSGAVLRPYAIELERGNYCSFSTYDYHARRVEPFCFTTYDKRPRPGIACTRRGHCRLEHHVYLFVCRRFFPV